MAKRVVVGEQFFTSPVVVDEALSVVDSMFSIGSFDVIVEPSAGAGAFFDKLPVGSRVGVDIEPLCDGVVEQDFFDFVYPSGGRVLTVGNPPYGRRGSLAVKFFERAAEFSDVVAFVLPRSFNKYTFQNRLNRNFHLVASFDCDEFFTPDGARVDVGSVFQVWERRDVLRDVVEVSVSHPDFVLRHAHLSRVDDVVLGELRDGYDFAIAQVGSNFRTKNVGDVVKGSHWFVKGNVAGVRERFDGMDFSFLDGMNTAHKSLSKSDIISAYVGVK